VTADGSLSARDQLRPGALWLLVAPHALGFTEHSAFWNSLAVGAVSTLAGVLAGYQEWWHPTTKRA
jgi:hypothetical protein